MASDSEKKDATPFGRTLYPLALLVWLAAFGWRVRALVCASDALARSNQRAEAQAEALGRGAKTLRDLTRESVAQSHEADFLESLPNILPEDKGYLRTQKAIGDEVADLRAKVGRRVKN